MNEARSVLHDEAALARRVDALAGEIAARAPEAPLVVVGLLTGAFVFTADLARALWRRGRDPAVELVHASHYGDGMSASGHVTLGELSALALRGRCVLLVDDVLDSGHTLHEARRLASAEEPAWLASCVLLDKPGGRKVPIEAEFVGFTAPDAWIVGYGMDLAGQLRGLPRLEILDAEE